MHREKTVKIGNGEVEDIEELSRHRGTTATKDGRGTEDIKKHLTRHKELFSNLMKIWKTLSIGQNTKIELFKMLVWPAL